MNQGTSSGDPSIDRNDAYYRQRWEEISDRVFTQTIFFACPALVQKELVNGCRMWQPYQGGEYDEGTYDLVEEMWDHEHCSICNARIAAGNTYWFNRDRIRLLCDECHNYFGT